MQVVNICSIRYYCNEGISDPYLTSNSIQNTVYCYVHVSTVWNKAHAIVILSEIIIFT